MIATSIVLYKHSHEELNDTLNCLIKNKYVNKIILVDNDASDWASNYIHEKIEYIKSPGNVGFGTAHNIAIKKFANNFQYFLICNPDIYFDQKQFNKLFEFALNNKAGLYLPKILFPNGLNQYGARLIPSIFNLFTRRFSPKLAAYLDNVYLLKKYTTNQPYFVPYLSGCFMLFDTKALINLNGFDEQFFMYMEDIDLSRRCADKFNNIYYPEAIVFHKHEQGSYKNKLLLKAHLQSAFQYFNKWGWFFDSNRQKLNNKCINQLEKII